jgi:hypothetical protein
VALRLTPNEEAALDALVMLHQGKADAAGVVAKIGAASVLRALLKHAAVAEGVWPSAVAVVPTEPAHAPFDAIKALEAYEQIARQTGSPNVSIAALQAATGFALGELHAWLRGEFVAQRFTPWAGDETAATPAERNAAIVLDGASFMIVAKHVSKQIAIPGTEPAHAPAPPKMVASTKSKPVVDWSVPSDAEREALRLRARAARDAGKISTSELALAADMPKASLASFLAGKFKAAAKLAAIDAALRAKGA